MESRKKILEKEWSPKNENPFNAYTSGSHFKAWWKCAKGHEWQAVIKSRYSGCNCPYCCSRLAWPGENDLKTLYPTIAAEWDQEKNGTLTPEHVTPRSNKAVWWVCAHGHKWKATVDKRVSGKGCPYCNHKLASAENNFAVIFPEKLKLWDWDMNSASPYELLPHSNKIVWWVCKQGHHWSTQVNHMVRRKTPGCPYCSGKRVIQGLTDLESTDPVIAAEWNYKRNILAPAEVSRFSHKKVYWICSEGHSYKAQIANRVNGRDCPICSGKRKQREEFIW
ncbi:MAG: zinc-ribbon domain-containing protein [Blautia sp.]